jgi:Putative prokaryotic signal transducing protein
MKTVASFSKPMDAHLLIARLEGAGIAAYARDENMVTLDWLASNAVGGVKVDVADEDFARALTLVAEERPLEAAPLEVATKRGIVGYVIIGLAAAGIASLAYGVLKPGAWSVARLLPIVCLSLCVGAIFTTFVALRNR